MKKLFVHAKYTKEISLPAVVLKKLPNTIALFTTAQFVEQLPKIKKQLEENRIKVNLIRPKHTTVKGQILGCNVDRFNADSFLFIGDGDFHPLALAYANNATVYTFNPFSKKLSNVDKSHAKKLQKTKEIALKKFYMSNTIGVLISTKPGQNRLKKAQELKTRLDKKTYLLISDSINPQSLVDFPFIECFVNTACPRISYDDFKKFPKPVIDYQDLVENLGPGF